MAAYEILLLNTAIPQIQAAQSGDTYLVPRDIAFSAALTLSAGTANGVPYLNASKVLTTGSALTFDGARLGVGISPTQSIDANGTILARTNLIAYDALVLQRSSSSLELPVAAYTNGSGSILSGGTKGDIVAFGNAGGDGVIFANGNAEQMRLTSTGLGIGTNNPGYKLDVAGGTTTVNITSTTTSAGAIPKLRFNHAGNDAYSIVGGGYMAWLSSDATERMRLDTAGNLGLGVTPSAWGASGTLQALQIKSTSLAGSGTNAYWGSNWYGGGFDRYITTGAASLAVQTGGQHIWYTAPSGTANSASVTSGASYTVVALGSSTLAQWQAFFNDSSNNPLTVTPTLGQVLTGNATGTLLGGGLVTQNISFTQAMTLDASGRLLLGTTGTPSGGTVAAVISKASTTNLQMHSTDGGGAMYGGLSGGGAIFYTYTGAVGSETYTERARITSGGYFKASDNGVYFGSTSTYHEFNQSALADSTIIRASNASYASSVLVARALRGQNSAYNLIYCDSGDGADAEFKFTGDGNGYADGTFNNNGADYAEYFESATGDALTVGATVVLDGNKVREATTDDPVSAIMGVVRPKEPSKASMVIGNTAWNKWANKYLTDDFDRYIMEDHEVVEWTDADGKQHSYESHNMPVDVTAPADAVRKTHDDKGNKFQHYKLNPAWNSDAEYTPREKRPEWNIIGLVGQVKVLKGKPVNDRWIKMRDVSASVEEWMIR